jgi:tetratricopeptide (TPR) repeat protein
MAAGIGFIAAGCGPSRHEMEQQASEEAAVAQIGLGDQNYSQAMTAIREAMRLNGELKNDSALADNYILLSKCQRQAGDYDTALASLQEAIGYFHSLNEQQIERRVRIALADFYSAIFDPTDALAIASDAASTAKVFASIQDAYQGLMIVARSCHALERYDEEVAALNELAAIDSQYYRGQNRMLFLKSMMEAYARAGDPGKTAEAFERWKSHAATGGEGTGLSRIYYSWGLYQESLARPDSAMRSFSRALSYAGKGRNPGLQAEILNRLGNLTYRSRRFADAHRYFSEALDLSRQSNSRAIQEMVTLALIACDAKAAQEGAGPSTAELTARCAAAVDSCRNSGFQAGAALGYFMTGRLTEAAGNPSAALPYYHEALDTYEQHSFDPQNESLEFINSYLEGEKTSWHDALLRFYCAAGRADSVFTLVERRNLMDLGWFFSRLSIKVSDQKIFQKVSAVQWNVRALRLLDQDIFDGMSGEWQEGSPRLKSLTGAYPERLQKIASSIAELSALNPNYPWLLYPRRMELGAIRGALPIKSALVEFIPSLNALYLLVITPDAVSIRTSPIGRQSLVQLMNDYSRLAGEVHLSANGIWVGNPAVQSRLNGLSSVLFRTIFAPILGDLTSVEKLYLVPPGDFGLIPLHTLRGEGRPLADRMNISYLPTAAALLFSTPPARVVDQIVAMGHPGRTAWDVEYELKDIRGFFENARMFFGPRATLNHLLDTVRDVVHIAAEFQFDANVPNNSVLLLADAGNPFGLRRVPLGELAAIPRSQAVVFSDISQRPGGMTHYGPLLFLANGTRTVVASVWQADRKAKKVFGEGFYTTLLAGRSASDAYQHAVEEMLKQPEFSQLQRWGLFYQYGK